MCDVPRVKRRRLVPILLVTLLSALAAGSAADAVASGGNRPASAGNLAAKRALEAAATRTMRAKSFGMFVLTGANPLPTTAILYEAPDRSIESDYQATKAGVALETVTIGSTQYSGLVSGTAEHSLVTTKTDPRYFDDAVLGYLRALDRLGGVTRHGQTFTATVAMAHSTMLVSLLFTDNTSNRSVLWVRRAHLVPYEATVRVTVAHGYVVSEEVTGVGPFDLSTAKVLERRAEVHYYNFDAPLAIAAPGPDGLAPPHLIG